MLSLILSKFIKQMSCQKFNIYMYVKKKNQAKSKSLQNPTKKYTVYQNTIELEGMFSMKYTFKKICTFMIKKSWVE